MKYFVFSVYDSVANVYAPPFYMASPNVAVRAFALAANTPDSKMAQHSADFTLFQLGEFDDAVGIHHPCEPHINLGLAASFKKEIASAS
ncbi:MAG: nonstructural protein [Microvirus sp.]|nr:MAG: nonstructural protein [Microvirus sp.]